MGDWRVSGVAGVPENSSVVVVCARSCSREFPRDSAMTNGAAMRFQQVRGDIVCASFDPKLSA